MEESALPFQYPDVGGRKWHRALDMSCLLLIPYPPRARNRSWRPTFTTGVNPQAASNGPQRTKIYGSYI
jgi:hypothetical protein